MTSLSRSIRADGFRVDGYFSAYEAQQSYNAPLADDILYVLSLSYQMMKKSLMGFAVYGIPFWVVTVGIISMM